MFDDYNMSLDILVLLLGLLLLGSPPLFKFFPSTRFILAAIVTTAFYIINVSFLLAFALALSGLYIVTHYLLESINGHVLYKHFILHRLETEIQTQLGALRQQEHQAEDKIRQFSEAMKEWDTANTALMKQIRAAEQVIQKKVRDWEPTPERAYYHASGGCTIWHKPQEPSASALARWWQGQEDPRVFQVSCDLDWAQARLETKTAALCRLQREHARLTDALKRVTRKKNEVGNRPDLGSWADASRHRATQQQHRQQLQTYQQPQPQYLSVEWFRSSAYQIPRRIEAAHEDKGRMLHVCVACAGGNHPWLHQYNTIAAAAASSLAYPCPAAQARLAASEWLAPVAPVGPPTAPAHAPPPPPPPPPMAAAAPIAAAPSPLLQLSAALPVLAPSRPFFEYPAAAPATAATPAPSPAPAPALALTSAPIVAPVPVPSSLASILTAKSSAPSAPATAVPAVPSLASILKPAPVAPAAPAALSVPVAPSLSSTLRPAPVAAPSPAPPPTSSAVPAPPRQTAPSLVRIVWPDSTIAPEPTPPTAGRSLMERTTFVSNVATTSTENGGLTATTFAQLGQEPETGEAGPATKKRWKGKEKATDNRATREEEETRGEGESAARYRQRY